ncbi:signal peptidase II [Actinomyces sp. MRS3W]|uniref:signal peptidase II n=1 Tax=Actinomyces sp. MRS3W TaxID=2800796 RepID=UPI0028FDBA4E|nr:signal peptidase II [Actinomyces sp. MRS3W]MDU0347893.1 signal peptidase II [Actinomyces sp. MRS3W]
MSDSSESPTPLQPATTDAAATSSAPRRRDAGEVKPRRFLIVLWALALGVVGVDQLTKVWAVAALSDGHRVQLLGDWLSFVLIRNPGAAFSFATGQTWIFALIAIAVTVVVIRVSRRLGSMWWAVALGLVLGGAVGNLIDRLMRAPGFLRGHVIDFIDYGGAFVGNVADIAIVCAAVIIMVLSVRGREIDGTHVGEGKGRHAEPAA